MTEKAKHDFACVFSCSEIPFVIGCLHSLTVMEGKQPLTQKGLMGKVRCMNRSLEQKLGLRNRLKQATKPGEGEHPKWDLASTWRLMLPCFSVPGNAWLFGQRKETPPNPAVGRETF